MNIFQNKSLKQSFTLIEMLIVLGIIAVILSISALSYSIVQKKSRDARRKGDLKTIQNAFEQYYAICGYSYPSLTGVPNVPTIACSNPATVLLPVAPVDPKSGTPYPMQTPAVDTAGYTVCTTLESESSSSYCVSNQQ